LNELKQPVNDNEQDCVVFI